MKKIVLKATKIPIREAFPEGPTIHRRDILKIMVKTPPIGGFDLLQMHARLKVLDKIEEAKGNLIELEDAEFDGVYQGMKHARWNFVHQDLIEFCDELEATKNNGEEPTKPRKNKKKRGRQR